MRKTTGAQILVWAKKIKAINLLGGKCECCGEDDIFKMCFHHKDPTKKDMSINKLREYRWSKIKEEVLKCQLLCNNCHIELHDSLIVESKLTYKVNKNTFLSFKNQFECEDCGYDNNNKALHFHHVGEKDIQLHLINKRYRTVYDLDVFLKTELNKCIVVCANCHVKRHADIEFFNKYKKEIYMKVNNYKELRQALDKNKVIEMYKSGIKQKDIVNHFGCAKSTISMIIKNMYR